MKDIRIRTTFPHHHKTQKLIRRIGKDGVYSLICLWLYVGENHPKGDISNLSNEDLAIAADWDKNPDDFVNTLIEVGFIDEAIDTDGNVIRKIHDWSEHNPFAFYAPERSEIARQNVLKRWGKKKGLNKPKDTNGIPSVYDSNTSGIRPSYQPYTPSPSPSPSPSPEKDIVEKLDPPFDQIIQYLNQKTHKNFRADTRITRKQISARWSENFSFQDFIRVIDNQVAAWLNDPKMAQYLRPQTLFGPKFESYLNNHHVMIPEVTDPVEKLKRQMGIVQ